MVQQKQVVGHDEEIGEEKCLPKAWRNAGVSEKKGDLCKWNTTSFKSLITEFLLLQDYISSYSAVNIQM